MSLLTPALPVRPIEYPDDDGKPMASNSEQGKWIVVLYGNLSALLRDVIDVYLAVDHLWYPVQGQAEIKNAPNVMVVFGRQRGKRGSYKQWEEDNVPVTVAFEVLSPGNALFEMAVKLDFYDEYGVQEYYLFDPDHNRLAVHVRRGDALRRVWKVSEFVCPRLGLRFDLSGPEMVIFYPDGRRFLTFEELKAERVLAVQRAKDAEQRLQDMQQRTDRQAELMRRVLRQQATAEELQELQQLLEQQPSPP